MLLVDLNGKWQMKRTDEAIWEEATYMMYNKNIE